MKVGAVLKDSFSSLGQRLTANRELPSTAKTIQAAQAHHLGFRLWLPISLGNAISRASAKILLA